MATANLSKIIPGSLPSAAAMRVGIIVSAWNPEITEALYQGARETLLAAGASEENIIRSVVPGSFELPLGAKWMLEKEKVSAVICLGCVIQGETRHFDFICHAVSNGIMQLQIESSTPVIFGVLTTDTLAQARDRSGGKHGNKGVEAAATAIHMVALRR